MRQARENLARSYLVLRDQELKAQRFLGVEYRNLFLFHQQIEIQRSQRLAAADQLEGRFKEFLVGRGTLDILLEAQRVWATALQTEYQAITQYNNALVAFEFAKGTIMQHDSVVIGEGPLPHCAQVRAVEHERQRSLGLVLRERANPIALPACDAQKGCVEMPNLPAGEGAPLGAVEVPAMLQEHESHNPLSPPSARGSRDAASQPANLLPKLETLSGEPVVPSVSSLAATPRNMGPSSLASQSSSAKPGTLARSPEATSRTTSAPAEDGWKKSP